MRYVALILSLAIASPGIAYARGRHVRHHVQRHYRRRRRTRSASQVAGALRDADRPAPVHHDDSAPAMPHDGPQEVDFDARVVQGQTNKSGAVYLYDRKDLKVKSMVKQPDTFRSEIAKGLLE